MTTCRTYVWNTLPACTYIPYMQCTSDCSTKEPQIAVLSHRRIRKNPNVRGWVREKARESCDWCSMLPTIRRSEPGRALWPQAWQYRGRSSSYSLVRCMYLKDDCRLQQELLIYRRCTTCTRATRRKGGSKGVGGAPLAEYPGVNTSYTTVL